VRGNPRVVGISLALMSAGLYGINPVFSVNAYDDGANSRGLMLARFALAAPLLLIVRTVRVGHLRWPRGTDLLNIFLLGFFGFCMQSFFYFGAIERMPSGLVSVIFYCFPVITVLLAWLLLRHKPNRIISVCLVATVAGVSLTAGSVSGAQADGVAFTLAGAVTYSFYVVLSSRIMPRYDGITGLTVILFGALAGYIVMWALPIASLDFTFPSSVLGWSNVLIIAVIGTIMSMGAFFAAMKRVGPGPTAVASTVEPVVTIAAGVMFLSESLTGRIVVGATLVIGAVVALTVAEARRVASSVA
jgi:drug/metabolite transporter (DMT)-like permease